MWHELRKWWEKPTTDVDDLIAAAKAVGAKEEREACAQALERVGAKPAGEYLIGKDTADLCAAIIRSRSNIR